MNFRKLLFIATLQVLGALIIVFFALCNIRTEQIKAASHVKEEVTSIIYLLSSYYNSELTHVIDTKSCQKKLRSLNDFVMLVPPLKSINISNPKFIFCSTFFQTRQVETPSWFLIEKNKQFIFSNYAPTNTRLSLGDRKVFLLQFKTKDSVTAAFSIYAENLYKLLHFTEDDYFELYLKVSNGFFSSAGPSNTKFIQDFIDGSVDGDGLFKVYYKTSLSRFITYTIRNYDGIIILWILTSILSSHYLYMVLFLFDRKARKIRSGLKRSQFYPYLQPLFDKNGQVCAAEVLARWIDEKGNVISPAEFIHEAEVNGLVKDITSQLVDKCIQSLKEVRIPPERQFIIGLNVCPIQFEDNQLFDDINRLISKLKRNNIQTAIEITERQEFASDEHYIASIDKLKEMDVVISLDDFGTGHCSLKYLHQVNVDTIKIDKSYISLIVSGNNNDVLENIIDLSDRLNVKLIAEGIETETQYNFLLKKNINCFQGFLLGKPIPINDFIKKYLS
ncbi:EAL domain-containing protein [Vibrio salinus]|uniref:EAL domain-containing protein n=1 Tax=Vibrio salinus TaxID=2899784 RepID=UPI001E2B078A|nr:EAL domain-containing protein [Vibrio salinus]MCE0495528.1 EAL domain-containing protein [Vibrio salinus]